MSDELVAMEVKAASEFALKLKLSGGECDCLPCGPDGPQQSHYDILRIELRDGRVFTGTTIHGHGGLHRVDLTEKMRTVTNEACERMLLRVRSQIEREPERKVIIYLVHRFFGSETLVVEPTEIKNIDVDDLGAAGLRRERWSRGAR